ncbi:hypothetical protein [uncultured Clostridium sp.]|nr:hypothetical protein [uncultured Clostridium sp.]
MLGHSNNNKRVFDTFDLPMERNPSASLLLNNNREYQYTSKSFVSCW